MARRIVGITGIGFWLVLIALVVGFQVKANGNEQIFKNLPDGWKVESSFTATREQTTAIGQKLGGKIDKLTNTVISFKGQQLQVNLFHCSTKVDTEKIYFAVLKGHNGIADFALMDGKLVVEFAKTSDVELARRARRALGLEFARLDSVARKLIRKIPAEWQVFDSFKATNEQTNAIGNKVGGSIKNLSNAIFLVQGKKFQVNVFECMTQRDAEKIQTNILRMKPDPAFCLRYENSVVEFVGDDVELARKAVYALGIQSTSIETQAKDLVNSLKSGDYDKATENFDDTMRGALPADKLKQVWNSLIVQFGPFVKQMGTRKAEIMGYDVIFVTCKFEKSVLDAKVVFNDKEQISGLFFVPAQSSDSK